MPHLLVIEGPAFRETSGGHRAVIDRTYNGSGSGAPKSLNIENVGRSMTAQMTARIKPADDDDDLQPGACSKNFTFWVIVHGRQQWRRRVRLSYEGIYGRSQEVPMRRVRYAVAMSFDGFIAGPNGEYDWIQMDSDEARSFFSRRTEAVWPTSAGISRDQLMGRFGAVAAPSGITLRSKSRTSEEPSSCLPPPLPRAASRSVLPESSTTSTSAPWSSR